MAEKKRKQTQSDKEEYRKVRRMSKFHILKGSLWGELKDVKQGKPDKDGKLLPSRQTWNENDKIEFLRKAGGIFINDIFIPLWKETSGLLWLKGSYGSSKTTYAITRLLVKCIENDNFKCFYGRQHKTMARELHDNIIREIVRNHWEHEFEYSMAPNGSCDIRHRINGNIFKLFGCDDIDSLKGIDNPTDIFVDEVNQISFESFGMLLTRLRTSGSELQFTGCFNPCDIMPDHWIRRFIFPDDVDGESSAKIQILTEAEQAIIDAFSEMNKVTHHSTYKDNYFQNPDSYWLKLCLQAGGDGERTKDYAEGRWGSKLNANPYYKEFKVGNHVFDEELMPFDKRLPLLFSFDKNTQPYLPGLIAQRHGMEIWFLDEVTAMNPKNSLYSVCPEIVEKYNGFYEEGMEVFGDATARTQDTTLQKGENFYTIALELLKNFHPILRVPMSNPSNKMRGLFLNTIFRLEYMGLKIKISRNCKKFIEDLQNCMEAIVDGKRNGAKDKSTMRVNGVSKVQPWGHLGDCMDYLICEEFKEQYLLFQSGSTSHEAQAGRRVRRNTFDERVLNSVEERINTLHLLEIEEAREKEKKKIENGGATDGRRFNKGNPNWKVKVVEDDEPVIKRFSRNKMN